MIAEHGFITFDKDGKITIDPDYEGEDEEIVHLIEEGGNRHLFYLWRDAAYFITCCGYDEKLMMSLMHQKKRKPYDEVVYFGEVSIGKFIVTAGIDEDESGYIFAPSLGREVIHIIIWYNDRSSWRSYIVIMPHGTFVFLESRKNGDGNITWEELSAASPAGRKCYKLRDNTSSSELRSILCHECPMMDIYMPPPSPEIKSRHAYLDIAIMTTD